MNLVRPWVTLKCSTMGLQKKQKTLKMFKKKRKGQKRKEPKGQGRDASLYDSGVF